MRKVNIGDAVTLPVHMEKGAKIMKGTVIGVYDRFFRVEFQGGTRFVIRESYSYYGSVM